MDTVVMGAVTGYRYFDIEPWLVSLKRTGYKGDIALACFDIDSRTIDRLKREGVIIIAHKIDDNGNAVFHPEVPTNQWNICVERFMSYRAFLDRRKYSRCITTDVKDVIFQRNPFDNLNFDGGQSIFLSSEGLSYKDEPWGDNNMKLAFPIFYKDMQSKTILNAGVIGGEAEVLYEFFGHIYTFSRSTKQHIPGGGGPDQAAVNILARSYGWEHMVDPHTHSSWACQAGTTADPNKIQQFIPNLLIPQPQWDGQYVLTDRGEKYAIVHQYDRVPLWKMKIDRMYREA